VILTAHIMQMPRQGSNLPPPLVLDALRVPRAPQRVQLLPMRVLGLLKR
jgi:hypothetical protein